MLRQKKILLISGTALCLMAVILPLFLGASALTSPEVQTIPATDMAPPQSASTSYDGVFVENVIRSYTIQPAGLIKVRDRYTFVSNQSSATVFLDVCLSDFEFNHLVYSEVLDATGSPMSFFPLADKIFGYHVFRIQLSEPLSAFARLDLSIKWVFNEVVEVLYGAGINTLDVQVAPVVPYFIVEYTSTVTVPDGSEQINFLPQTHLMEPEGGDLEYTGMFRRFYHWNLTAFEDIQSKFSYVNAQIGVITILSVDRTIRINPWGYIHVTEDYLITSSMLTPMESIPLQFPGDTYHVNVTDDLGEIKGLSYAPEFNDDGTKNMSILLYVNRALLRAGNQMAFTLSYYLPYEEYHTQNFGTHNFRIDLFTVKSQYIIKEMSTTLELIGTNKIERSNLEESAEIESWGMVTLYFEDSNVISDHQFYIDLTYSNSALSMLSRIFLFSIGFMALLGLYVVSRTVRQEDDGESEYVDVIIPIGKLTRFIELYEEKNAVLIDLEKAEADMLKKRIQKKAYNKMEKNFSGKIKELDTDLVPFKKELVEASKDFRFIIQKLDYLEAEKISVNDSIRLLSDRYKKGKLPSKAAYQRLSEDLMKRMISAQKKIDKNINDLRAFLV
jgi:hypothetical protein